MELNFFFILLVWNYSIRCGHNFILIVKSFAAKTEYHTEKPGAFQINRRLQIKFSLKTTSVCICEC